jgi:hypothetical protein
MAKFIPGPTIADIRNKLGGVVYLRNRGGTVARAWFSTTKKITDYGNWTWAIMSRAQAAWQNTLSEQQRQAWIQFAATQLVPSVSSIPGPINGHDLFVKLFCLAQRYTFNPTLDPPQDLQVPPLDQPSLSFDPSANSLLLAFSPSPVPAGATYAVSVTPPLSPGISNPGAKYRPLAVLLEGESSPINLAQLYAYRWPAITAGHKCFLTIQAYWKYNSWPGPKLSCWAAASTGGTLTMIYEGTRVHRTSNQSIPNNAATIISFDAARYNVGPMWAAAPNPTRLTAQRGGVYSITANFAWAAQAGGFRSANIILNGATIIAIDSSMLLSNNGCDMHVSTNYKLTPGDYIELQVYQNSGVAVNVASSNAYSPEFTAQWLSD